MPFCTRCGELCRSEKCQKCGKTISALQSTPRSGLVDRWQSRYLGNVMGLESLKSPSARRSEEAKSPLRNRQFPSGGWRPSILDTKRVSPAVGRKTDTNYVTPTPVTASTTSSNTTITADKTCAGCRQKLGGKTVKLPDSQVRFHWACLKCTHCQEPFRDTSFSVDQSSNIYHPQCISSAVPYKTCTRCSTLIKDAYIKIHSMELHPRCFRCVSCQKVLQSSSIYIDLESTFYCQPCAKNNLEKEQIEEKTKIVPQLQPPMALLSPATTSPLIKSLGDLSLSDGSYRSPNCSAPCSPSSLYSPSLSSSPAAVTASSAVKPSSLMSRRARPLPKFGVRKTCPGCQETIQSVHEEKPGPKATRWHNKCLKCTGCSKSLDSGATVHPDATGNLNPWCTMCLLVKKKTDANQQNVVLQRQEVTPSAITD